MIELIPRVNLDYKELREKYLGTTFVRFQFTSKRKKMSTVLSNIDDNEYSYDKRVHVKGASEIVLGNCSHWLNADGER